MPVERQEVICERAYAIWEQEGRPDGRDVVHWLQAENEIDPTAALLKVIRDAMFISNRAFVFLRKIDWQFIGQKSTHTIVSWTFTPQWENSGNTPTKYMTSRINYIALDRAVDSTFEWPDMGDLEVGHTMIAPKAIMHGAQLHIAVDVLDKIKTGNFTSIFGDGRTTMMYSQAHPDIGRSFASRSLCSATYGRRIANFSFSSKDVITASTTNVLMNHDPVSLRATTCFTNS
jgi:hypothetical protein